jgi:very-short-patch-repair endonuclease
VSAQPTEGRTGGIVSLIARARQLRKHMTPEEVKLWVQLKHFNARGFNFRRQAPCDGYILDFVDFNTKLIIEVDGSQHGEAEGARRDAIRDQHFTAKGFTVLRFWNVQINREMDGVIDQIESVLAATPPVLRTTSP